MFKVRPSSLCCEALGSASPFLYKKKRQEICGGTAEWCVERAPKSLSLPGEGQTACLSEQDGIIPHQVKKIEKKKKKNAASSDVKRKRQVKKKKFPRTEMKDLNVMVSEESVWPCLKEMQI